LHFELNFCGMDKDGIFVYGEEELQYLRTRCKKMAWAIDRLGKIERRTNSDVFSSLVYSVVGQQVSMTVHKVLWERLQNKCGDVNPVSLSALTVEEIRAVGLSNNKAVYVKGIAESFASGNIDINVLKSMSDEDAIKELTKLNGVGRWTAEMLLLFSLQRKDILSYDDLAIQRGLRMLYHHRKITKELFAKYKRRYSPYGSIASFYLWAIAGNNIPELRDPKPHKKN